MLPSASVLHIIQCKLAVYIHHDPRVLIVDGTMCEWHSAGLFTSASPSTGQKYSADWKQAVEGTVA